MKRSLFFALSCATAMIACGSEGAGPDEGGQSVAVQTGDAQFGTRGALLAEPLQVIVTDPVSKRAQANIQVQWSIVEGTGATLTSTTSSTDAKGVASTQLRLGNNLGNYGVQAATAKVVGSPARFTARAVEVPSITAVAPTSANAGDTVTITGQNFSTVNPDDNAVTFGGFRGRVVTATNTQIRAVVPLCVPSRPLPVQVALGAVTSNQATITVSGTTASALQLTRGQVRAFSDPNELSCFRLPGGVTDLTLLMVPQNFSEVVGSVASTEIAGLTAGGVAATVTERMLGPLTPADEWEWRLRRKERELVRNPAVVLRQQYSNAAACPAPVVGVRCDFKVINKQSQFDNITAELKAITVRALVYQDVATSSTSGLTTADFNALGQVFDDPIYAADVAAFGTPSDLDRNNRIIILLTPVVNSLTDRGGSGFIAGFFYGCDLLARSACSGSNEAEIFYALTTDPTGQFSDIRTRQTVMSSLPAVIAHEFQHMIHFAQRGNSTDALWLSEGLAHHAEDVVADAFEARGELSSANQFRAQNYTRANRFLRATASTSLLAEEEIGSLELRGAAWLFVKYLVGQFGNEILQKLTRSTQSSVSNVTAQTGKPWASLLSDWGVALWADDAPELAGATVRRENTFPNINLREKLRSGDGSYPLKPVIYPFEDFIHRSALSASSQDYIIVQATGTSPKALNLTFGGQRGGPFAANAAPQMTILRIK